MLLSGANIPVTVHQQDQMVQVFAEYSVDEIDTVGLKKSFTSEFSEGVYRFTLKRWGGHPHFSQFYFDENKKRMLFSATTDRGFLNLVKAINQFGYEFSQDPDIRVNMSMLITAGKILKKKLELNPYENLFHVDTPPEDKEFLDRMNTFMRSILPDINTGRTPDIEKHAAAAGVDIETARDLVQQLMKKFGSLK